MLLDHDVFIGESKERFSDSELGSMDADDGVFPVTNRGIQIRMLLCPYRESKSIFRAYLQCRSGRFSVTIDLVYYRYQNAPKADLGDSPEFSQVYL